MLFPLVIFLHSSSPFIYFLVKAFYFKMTVVNVCWSKMVQIFLVLWLLFAFRTLQQMLLDVFSVQ